MQLLLLLPLLIKPATKEITLQDGDKVNVLVESNDTLSLLLPFLLIGGLGGDSMNLSGGGTTGGLDTTMLILILALSGGLGGRRA